MFKNGQIIGKLDSPYQCGGSIFTAPSLCIEHYEYRVRKVGKYLILTWTTDRPGQLKDKGEMVLDAAFRKNNPNIYPEFAQSQLFQTLASDETLKSLNLYGQEIPLSSEYTRDNESILVATDINTTPLTPGNPNNPTAGDGTTTGLTLDQLLPYLAGAVVLIGLTLIVVLVKRR
ncbi:hypothetical protein [Fibrella forsythiae]|uniref:S-layer family duplication domain-containing protein n=1 Tax=Fibrella forsythiae TaxID=2817061 RepID=A0ABS3JAJ3_9BACT|nr:hypothetical protein [Fibrella forsythiae]MBO0947006.1 hypothetical protein [Fibrella forsythiae]